MDNPLIRKLELFCPLPDDDKRFLDEIVTRKRSAPPGMSIIREGDSPSDVHLVCSGLAGRYKVLQNGGKQIFAYLLPGDFCDLHVFILKEMDHGIETLSECELVDIPRALVLEMTRRPEIARALWWVALVDEAILREWLVNLGQRDAAHRIAHLFCEMHLRLNAIGLVERGSFPLSITQVQLGYTIGMTPVHVNRTLRELRAARLLEFKNKRLYIPDVARMRAYCDFYPNYLHLTGGKKDGGSAPTNY